MILDDPRDAALEMVRRALKEELPEGSSAIELAESLVAIAVNQNVPVEYLVRWIRLSVRGRHWSASEWRRWCLKYHDGLREAQALQDRDSRATEQEWL